MSKEDRAGVYTAIDPPVPMAFGSISQEDAQMLFQWHLTTRRSRIAILSSAIQAAFPDWVADCSRESVSRAAAWWQSALTHRTRTDEEKMMVAASGPVIGSGDVSDAELTLESVSMCHDFGTYLGEVQTTLHPNLEWRLYWDKPDHVDHGQAVISGYEDGIVFNPVRTCLNLAYAAIRSENVTDRVERAMRFWDSKA